MADQVTSPRVVVITGASSGIGRAAAQKFAAEGWRVGLVARGADTLDETRRDVVTAGGTASVAVADVADSAQLEAAAAHIEAELGPIDVWVNNAGVSVYGRFWEIPEDEYRTVTETNYFGTVNGTRTALKRMRPRNKGTIVQILSAISYRGVPLQSPYSGSKYALRGFTEALRAELVDDKSDVHVTMVHPPAVNTPFYNHAVSHMPKPVRPPPPVYQPEIIADAIYLAATTRRREVKVTAQTVFFAIANKVAPGLLDWGAGQGGVAMQQSDQGGAVAVRDPNLREPGKLNGTHGPFDNESLGVSAQMWVNKNPAAASMALSLGLLGLALLVTGARRGPLERSLGRPLERMAHKGLKAGGRLAHDGYVAGQRLLRS